mmetsp:Transcript_18179/g.28459  ORF Transcript_18179/g.28459 Transcript_18179/m.28459 type:complete len:649 (-) Transcript_18179:7740-9686(-)
MISKKTRSVGDVIKSVLPDGSNPPIVTKFVIGKRVNKKAHAHYPWLVVPEVPTDLFAVAAHLCSVAGLLSYFNPSPYAKNGDNFQFVFNRDDRDEVDDMVWHWRGGRRGGRADHPDVDQVIDDPGPRPPQTVQAVWDLLLANWDMPVVNGQYYRDPEHPMPPDWWRAVFSLCMISDLVCARIFQEPMERFQGMQLGSLIADLYSRTDEGLTPPTENSSTGHIRSTGDPQDPTRTTTIPRGPASLTLMTDTSIVCVMPKIRVAAVGATMRNVSRNLALLPGRGEMRCFWDMTDTEPESEDKATLDILLIPAPFALSANDFRPCADQPDDENPDDFNGFGPSGSANSKLHRDKPNWENFELRQPWIIGKTKQEEFIRDCVDLLKKAQAETRTVNAVVFPEYALTYDMFDRICFRLKEVEENLEFIIAGSSDNCDGETANTLLTRVWQKRNPTTHITNSRRKQHRWRLDRRQVESYGLGTSLNPLIANWWETSAISQRELYFHRFRQGSAFAALICEELARSDVCHDVLRSVGPNLVFALLMDSAQVPSRWSAQYAASLADDPGCSVLSFTSYGLVERANRLRSNGSASVALWKDDTGRLVEIPMPPGQGARGILLSLWSKHVQDQTITGKRSIVRAWRYSSHYPVTLSAP